MPAYKVAARFAVAVSGVLLICLGVVRSATAAELPPIDLCPAPQGWALEFPMPDLGISAKVDCIHLTFVDVEPGLGPSGKRGPRAVEIRAAFEADVASLNTAIPRLIGNRMPGSSCKEHWQHKGTDIRIANGTLTFVGFLGYENWWCWEHNWICCANWSCHGCSRTESGKIFELSPSVHGLVNVATATPYETCSANPAASDQTLKTNVNVRQEANLSDDQKFLVRVLGSIVGGISGGLAGVFGSLGGSTAGWVLVDKEMEQLQRPDLRQEYPFPLVRLPQEEENKIYFCTREANFTNRPAGFALQVNRVARTSRTKAEQLWKILKAQQAYEADKVNPITEATVAKGEGFWRVAERLYGDGRYYVLLQAANPSLKRRVPAPGETIKLPRFSQVVSDRDLIREGDTLWAIAERRLGDGRRYRELIRGHEQQFRDPNRIVPLWSLQPVR